MDFLDLNFRLSPVLLLGSHVLRMKLTDYNMPNTLLLVSQKLSNSLVDEIIP